MSRNLLTYYEKQRQEPYIKRKLLPDKGCQEEMMRQNE